MQYEVVAVNNSGSTGTFCLYQSTEGSDTPAFPVAWFTKMAANTSSVYFRWTIEYDFVWGETGVLRPGVIFNAAQTWKADVVTANMVTLTRDGAYTFANLRNDGPAGALMIVSDATVPASMLAAGIGMSGGSTLVGQTMPNFTQAFAPRPQYRLAFGADFQKGQVLDESSIQKMTPVNFPPNIYSLQVTLESDGSWTIDNNRLPFKLE